MEATKLYSPKLYQYIYSDYGEKEQCPCPVEKLRGMRKVSFYFVFFPAAV